MSVFGVPTRTVGDVFSAVKRKFGDESGVQLETNDLVSWINDAQRAIVTKNKVLKAVATTPVVIGTAVYDLSAITPRIHQIESLLIDGRRIGNMTVSQAEESIAGSDPTGVEPGFPEFWYEWAGQITFWPVPDSGTTITIRYTAVPNDITANEATILSVPDVYYPDVVNYVLKQAYEMDENEPMLRLKGEEFEMSMSERGEEERTAQHMTYETITIYDL